MDKNQEAYNLFEEFYNLFEEFIASSAKELGVSIEECRSLWVDFMVKEEKAYKREKLRGKDGTRKDL